MFDEAVELGVAAFLEGDGSASDATVLTNLTESGLEPWLAERLTVFLPLAFGRRVLPGVSLSDSFHDGPTLRALMDEPVFRAAAARAEVANRSEVERIGLRSSEVNAVNNALNSGSRLEDLVVGPAALAVPLPPPGTGDGGAPSPRAAFAAFLTGHGFAVEGARVGDFEFDARLYPQPRPLSTYVMAQVDFAVRHPELATDRLIESFAGVGETWREAINQSILKFERASLHPIIAALLDRTSGQDQVSWEPYPHPAGPFDFCLGPQITLFTPDSAPPAGPLLDQLLRELRGVPLSRAIHTLRLFTCHQDGSLQTNEVLLDGDPWAAGEAVVAAAPAPATAGMVGVRIFGLLVPARPRVKIVLDDLSGPEIAEFLDEHVQEMRSITPLESKHALDLDGLRQPEITFWSAWDGDTLVGCAAIKMLDAEHAELKSMRTKPSRKRSGIASLLLDHVIAEAGHRGYARLSLETGAADFFHPARKLYEKFGFRLCEPFADYRPDPSSVFMTLAL